MGVAEPRDRRDDPAIDARASVLRTATAGLAAALLLAASVLPIVRGWEDGGWGVYDIGFLTSLVVSATLGWRILTRYPRHAVGWVLMLNALVLSQSALAEALALGLLSEDPVHPLGRATAIWSSFAWPLLFAPYTAIAWLFPDGRLPSPRWRWPALAAVAAFVVQMAGGLLGQERPDRPFDALPPVGLLPDPVSQVMQWSGLAGMGLAIIAGVVALVRRFRASTGLERDQIKGLALVSVGIPISITVGTLEPGSQSAVGPWTEITLGVTLTLIPLAIGLAVLRYRLYDLDRLISATVLYAGLTVLLGSIFAAVVLLGGVLLGRGSPLPTAVATLAAALAFRPLREWLQRAVDRRFNRARYTALARLEEFLQRLGRGEVEPEQLQEALAQAVADPALLVFYEFDDAVRYVDPSGRQREELPDHPPDRTPITRGPDRIATVLHSPDAGGSPRALAAVLSRAGLAFQIGRLRAEVRRQLAEVEASRRRIVAAAEAERRRLEQDLHDGAQQRLVGIGLDLRHLQADPLPPAVSATLDAAVDDLAEAIRELRDLAHGIRPRLLDAGLERALRDLAARSPVPTAATIEVGRLPAPIESACFFVASEAMANAAKHARASAITLTVTRGEGHVVMAVDDDGVGGAAVGRGDGLTGMRDRVAALGGTAEVTSPAGQGTSVRVRLPCES